MKVAFRMVKFAAVAPLLAFAAGCAESGGAALVGPEAAPALTRSAPRDAMEKPALQRLARFRARPHLTVAWAKQWIGPEGGRLEFQGFAVDVPAGAVSRVTQFSIRLPVDPQGAEHVVAEFGPHNTEFARPVTIELPYGGTSIENSPFAGIVWWNGGLNGWVDMGGEPTSDGERLLTTTTHFSTYGTTEVVERGGTITASGG